jgi:tellurite resistance protein TerC
MLIWVLFILLIMIFLAVDLGVFNKESHVISGKEAGKMTTLWCSVALLFSVVIYYLYANNHIANPHEISPWEAGLLYLTGYLVEISLSMDNIFVMSMIFTYFAIPKKYQHRVLFWGILGAIIFRAIMILIGVTLIEKFHWTIYLFGFILLYSAYKMSRTQTEENDFEKNKMVRLLRKVLPVTNELDGEKFMVKIDHKWFFTPLFIVLFMIEISDVVFAVDSIPAILGITTDSFIVFSSNIFAILGLRSMYFLLDSLMTRFRHLHYSLIFILSFVGIKMLLTDVINLPVWISLVVIIGALAIGVLVSLFHRGQIPEPEKY